MSSTSAALAASSAALAAAASSVTEEWGYTALDADAAASDAPKEEVEFTSPSPVRRGATITVNSDATMPFGVSAQVFRETQAKFAQCFTSKAAVNTHNQYKFLTGEFILEAGKPLFFVCPPRTDKKSGARVSGDVDEYWTKVKDGKSRHIPGVTADASGYLPGPARRLAAFFIHGQDVLCPADETAWESLSHYLPGAKPLVESIPEAIAAKHPNVQFTVVNDLEGEHRNPLVFSILLESRPVVTDIATGETKALLKPSAPTHSSTKSPKTGSYAALTTGGAGGAGPRPHLADKAASPAPSVAAALASKVDYEFISEMLVMLASLAGKTGKELEKLDKAGMLPSMVRNLGRG
jgi:hypothetical protein